MRHILHDDIYQDRKTEKALCYDFPADKNLISGLHSLQAYFITHGTNIEIPVVRIMNTAHRLVSYMYATTCSGDQNEYDAMTYNSVGRDKQLMFISLIVLAAMLKRTEGQRAKTCRSIVMEDRSEDFYEGVSLYEQWLSGGSEHYSDEDFQIDLMDELNEYKAQLNAAQNQIYQLQKQLAMKEERQSPIIHVAGNYIDIHDNNHCNIYATEPPQAQEEAESIYTPPIPREGDYNGVRLYIEERKKYDQDFKIFCQNHNRKDLCSFLTKQFGWYVDDNSLCQNIRRNM